MRKPGAELRLWRLIGSGQQWNQLLLRQLQQPRLEVTEEQLSRAQSHEGKVASRVLLTGEPGLQTPIGVDNLARQASAHATLNTRQTENHRVGGTGYITRHQNETLCSVISSSSRERESEGHFGPMRRQDAGKSRLQEMK